MVSTMYEKILRTIVSRLRLFHLKIVTFNRIKGSKKMHKFGAKNSTNVYQYLFVFWSRAKC